METFSKDMVNGSFYRYVLIWILQALQNNFRSHSKRLFYDIRYSTKIKLSKLKQPTQNIIHIPQWLQFRHHVFSNYLFNLFFYSVFFVYSATFAYYENWSLQYLSFIVLKFIVKNRVFFQITNHFKFSLQAIQYEDTLNQQ